VVERNEGRLGPILGPNLTAWLAFEARDGLVR
jgi:hypothetical protein